MPDWWIRAKNKKHAKRLEVSNFKTETILYQLRCPNTGVLFTSYKFPNVIHSTDLHNNASQPVSF